ncbi:MAG: hypothetical protein M0Q92_06610 [Methanoregula sp.]|nr:hypothetical protein [Methanoregula sp.]
MHGPYLESGESLVLTTDRISLDNQIYEAMLTTRNLILIDSTNARFEPRIIPLATIRSVRSGKAATSEPVIILTLQLPDETNPGTRIIIFIQEPLENRKHDRDLWVQKLIELSISGRVEHVQDMTASVSNGKGIQPSVRHWLAPEAIRPRKENFPVSPPPRDIIIVMDEPEPAAVPEILPVNEITDESHEKTGDESVFAPPGEDSGNGDEDGIGFSDIPALTAEPEEQPVPEPVMHDSREEGNETAPDEVSVPAPLVTPPPSQKVTEPAGSLAATIRAAVRSLASQREQPTVPDSGIPAGLDGKSNAPPIRRTSLLPEKTDVSPVTECTEEQATPSAPDIQEHLSAFEEIERGVRISSQIPEIQIESTKVDEPPAIPESPIPDLQQLDSQSDILEPLDVNVQPAIPEPPIPDLQQLDSQSDIQEPLDVNVQPAIPEPPIPDLQLQDNQTDILEPLDVNVQPVIPESPIPDLQQLDSRTDILEHPDVNVQPAIPEPPIPDIQQLDSRTDILEHPDVNVQPAIPESPIPDIQQLDSRTDILEHPDVNVQPAIPESPIPDIQQLDSRTDILEHPDVNVQPAIPESPIPDLQQLDSQSDILEHPDVNVQPAIPEPPIPDIQQLDSRTDILEPLEGDIQNIANDEVKQTPVGGAKEPKITTQAGGPIPPASTVPTRARSLLIAGGVVLCLMLVVIAAILLQPGIQPQDYEPVTVVPTTVTATIPTTTTAIIKATVPLEGVGVRIVSTAYYTGQAGNPGYLQPVSGPGERYISMHNNNGLVQVSVEKQEYTNDELLVEIYSNGTLITSRSTTVPRGSVDMLIDPATGNPPGIDTDKSP